MLDTTDDIAEGISFQAFEDDCRLLASLLHDVLLRELGPRFIHILERNRILAQVYNGVEHLNSAYVASMHASTDQALLHAFALPCMAIDPSHHHSGRPCTPLLMVW